MGKLKMAHELLVSALKGGTHLGSDHVGTAQYFFDLADAMQVEADKRNFEAKNTNIGEFQIDWSQAPEWAEWWAVGKDTFAVWFDGEPSTSNGYLALGYALQCDTAPQFNYKGNWKDSLHKRPDIK